MSRPKLSRSGVPVIPMNEPMNWEDWLKGRRARRETGLKVASGKLFAGERGPPFTPTDRL